MDIASVVRCRSGSDFPFRCRSRPGFGLA